jgi:D-alanine-D-alanine ligase
VATGLNVVVLLGGPSAEREVSLRSGGSVAVALESLGHRVTRIDPRPGELKLPAGTDVVFIALHGTYGEDGQVQAELEKLGVAYTGCGFESSRIAFNKVETKQRCHAHGIATAKFSVIDRPGSKPPKDLKLPLVLKPVGQGSSVGLSFVDAVAGWSAALENAFAHGDEILIEEKIEGREVTVGILAGMALPVVEVRPKGGRYDYENKYTAGNTEYLCPAPFAADVTMRIQQAGLKSFLAVGGRDYGRVDIIVRASGEPVMLEVNTLPGMTETSLLPKAAAAAGITFGQLCQRMIDLALEHQHCAA